MREVNLNRVKNIFKINSKKEAEKYLDIPKDIIETELNYFNIKLGQIKSSDEAKTLYYQFKSKLSSLSEIDTPVPTEFETDEEFKQKTIDISIESIQSRMRAKLSEIEKQKNILNSQDTNLKNKFLLKEDINKLFKIEIGICMNMIHDEKTSDENEKIYIRNIRKLDYANKKFLYLINKYYDTIYITVLLDLRNMIIECIKTNKFDEMTNLLNEFENKYSLNLHRVGSKDIDYSIIKRTRLDLSLYNINQYRDERKKAQLEFTRLMDAKLSPTIDLLFNNQIDRFKIIKEEEEEYKNIKSKYNEDSPIPIETLQTIFNPKFIYDQEFALKVKEYNNFLEDLKKHGDQFLNEFLAFIEFHESALQLYKHHTNEMYIQLGFSTTETYNKEIGEKQKYLEQQEAIKKY